MSSIRVIIIDKITKADWEHNFAIVDAVVDAFGGKLDISQKAAANGVASLNSDSKVIQIALNSERLNGKTEAQLSNMFILFSAKGAANGVAELDAIGKLKASQLPESVSSGLQYQGTWNANTNEPEMDTAASGNKGYFFVVSTAGTTNIDGINSWAEGDWILSNGSTWEKVPAFSANVISVAGKTGNVTLGITDIIGLLGELASKQVKGSDNELADAADMNDLIKPGEYYFKTLEGVGNTPNAPAGETLAQAFLSVRAYAGFKAQELTLFNTGKMFNRVFNETWSNWKAIN